MARILIDGKEYEVRDGDHLLAAALDLRLNLPYFCWHPAFGSVGACRQCAVKQYKDEDDTRGRLVMACMTPVADGARFSIDDKEAREFRASVIEWLMLNHPHDCPVCDEGGECHLQDMTVMTGHVYRRTRLPKRTFVSQDLGPFIAHEMNRCITCYRCVRFYRDYAGGEDLHAFASKNHVYFGRQADGPLESPFSGNLAEVCPTGVFTDKTLAQHYTRKWDLQSAPSICVHCGGGCNTFAAERYGTLRRTANRYHAEINGYFLCDRGRFGYEFVNGVERIREPWIRSARGGVIQTSEAEAAVQHLVARLQGKQLVGIGSPRASIESNFALRQLVGEDHFYSGMDARTHRLTAMVVDLLSTVRGVSLSEAERCDAVLILGEDVEATFPRLALALRQAVRNAALDRARELEIPLWQDASVRDATNGIRSPLYILSALPTGLDSLARHAGRYRPELVVALAQAVGVSLGAGPHPDGLSDAHWVLAQEIAEGLRGAQRPLIVTGVLQGDGALLSAAQMIAASLGDRAGVIVNAAECNSVGATLLGGRPMDKLPTGSDVAILVLENDLFRRAPAHAVVEQFAAAHTVVAFDHLTSRTTDHAEAVFPTATYAEASGGYVNHEGRLQRAYQVYVPAAPIRESWRWFGEIGAALGRTPEWASAHAVLTAAAQQFPVLAPGLESLATLPADWRIARQSHRYSGRTAMQADKTMHEPPPPADPDGPLAFSMEGYGGPIPASLAPRYWAPGWNSYQAVNFYQQQIGGPLRGGDGGVQLLRRRAAQSPGAEPSPASTDGWVMVPLYHVFGSDELSARAPAIAARALAPHALLHPEDAEGLGITEGDAVEIAFDAERWRLPVRLSSTARGIVGVSAGMGPAIGCLWPRTVGVRRSP